jgi:hypothetical protein
VIKGKLIYAAPTNRSRQELARGLDETWVFMEERKRC